MDKSRNLSRKRRKKIAFVICPLGEPKSETRIRSNQILDYVIRPVVSKLGYEVQRIDRGSEPGIITNRIIEHVLNDALVVADLTDRNANVFYELALRHARRKPYVLLMEKNQKPPFDIAQTRIIFIDHKDLTSVEEAKIELEKQIVALQKDPKKFSESPFSIAIGIQKMRKSSKPIEQSIAELREIAFSNSTRLQDLVNQMTNLAIESLWETESDKSLLESRIKKLMRAICPMKGLEEEYVDLFKSLFVDEVRETYRDNCELVLKIRKKDVKGSSIAKICVEAEYKVHNVTEQSVLYHVPFNWNTYSFEKLGVPIDDHLKIEKILITKDTGEHIDLGKKFKCYELKPRKKPPLKVELSLPLPNAEIGPFGWGTVYLKFWYLANSIDDHTQRMVHLTRNLKLRVNYSEADFFVDIDDFCLPKKLTINPGHEFEWKGWFLPRHGFAVEWKPVKNSGTF